LLSLKNVRSEQHAGVLYIHVASMYLPKTMFRQLIQRTNLLR
jgi:hypothetical protein